MPVRRGKDSKGSYYRWGYERTTKYYYTPGNKKARNMAKKLALEQGKAIYFSKLKKLRQ